MWGVSCAPINRIATRALTPGKQQRANERSAGPAQCHVRLCNSIHQALGLRLQDQQCSTVHQQVSTCAYTPRDFYKRVTYMKHCAYTYIRNGKLDYIPLDFQEVNEATFVFCQISNKKKDLYIPEIRSLKFQKSPGACPQTP